MGKKGLEQPQQIWGGGGAWISFAGVEEGSVEKPNWDGHRIKIFDWFGV